MKRLILISALFLSSFVNISPAASKDKMFFDWVACVENTLKGRKPLTFKEKSKIMKHEKQIKQGRVETKENFYLKNYGTKKIIIIARDDIVILLNIRDD